MCLVFIMLQRVG